MEKRTIAGIIVGIIALAAIWYLASPLFINKTVNEAIPENSNSTTPSFSTSIQGNFVDADSFHKTSGSVKVIQNTGEETKYLRLENFKTTNGPDLKVYLSNDLEAKDYISLGDLKGNIGDQNYEIPSNVNPEEYSYALIWCEQFHVLFGSAKLQ